MYRAIAAMMFGTFALGMAEFAMMGILSDVAAAMNVSISGAGDFISAYSGGVALGAPLLLFMRRLPLRHVMCLLALTIMAGNILAALSANSAMLLVARFISGLPHGCFFGAGALVASKVAGPGRGAMAVALMVTGMTIATVIGVPLSTLLAQNLSWRAVFGVVGGAAAISALCCRIWIPALRLRSNGGIRGQFAFLRHRQPWLIYAGVFFGQGSVYCWYSYIEPMMTRITGFAQSAMVLIMAVGGLGMFVGGLVAGRMADRHNPAGVTAWICTGLLIVMPLIYFCAHYRLPEILLTFVATACLFGIGGPLQYLITRYAQGGEMLGAAGIQIAFNVSNAMSAAFGGALIAGGYSLASPALAGVPLAMIAAIALFTLKRDIQPTT